MGGAVSGRTTGFSNPVERIDRSPPVSDSVQHTTCYMCACRCGIRVHLKDGRIRYIEGNPDHPVNRGVLCGKGSAGIMQHYSPARLSKPLLRTGERGAGTFREIEWEEALTLATEWLGKIRATDPKRLAFFTGRDQSQSFTGWWAKQFGTPNFAAHGGFCSVNMAAAGLYSVGGSFWEFGDPDWDRTKYFLMFGVAEDHDSNPIKTGLAKLKARGAKFISVNPVQTGYSAIADEFLAIRPGTDGLFVLALVHELLRLDRVDLEFLVRYTNAAWLVIDAPGTAGHGLFARDAEGRPLAWDRTKGAAIDAATPEMAPQIVGEVRLEDGRTARPVFHLLAERYLDGWYAPEAVADRCGIPADTIRRIASEIAEVAFDQAIELDQPWTDTSGRRHATMRGRPVAMHAMRGISAHSNGFHTCRAIHLLQMLLGAVDTPGSWRYKSPFPRPIPPGAAPVGKGSKPNTMMPGMSLGFPRGPEDLLIEDDGSAVRIDKAFTWDAPLALHGLMQSVIANAHAGDPYKIDTLFMYMANMAWNSAMNPADAARMLTDKDPATGEYSHPARDLCRCVLLGDGGACRSGVPRHHLSGTLGLHLPARPADRQPGRTGRCDPPAGAAAGSRRPPVPGRADRARGAAETARLRHRDRCGHLPRLRRLHRQPPARTGGRPAGRVPRRRRHRLRRRRAQPGPVAALHRKRRVLGASSSARGALLQARQRRLPGGGEGARPDRLDRADRAAALQRAVAEIPPRRRGARPRAAAGQPPRADPPCLRSAADLVSAARTDVRVAGRLSAVRDHPAADGDVSFLAFAERLAAPDPRGEPALHEPRHRGRARHRRRRLGVGDQPHRAGEVPRCG